MTEVHAHHNTNYVTVYTDDINQVIEVHSAKLRYFQIMEYASLYLLSKLLRKITRRCV